MPLSVLSLVQDADNVQVVCVVQKIDYVRATQVLLEVWQDTGRATTLCSFG